MLEFHLIKQFGAFRLDIASKQEREWLVLLAPSGAGKSLTLNMIAGLERPDNGFVHLGGETLFDQKQGINLAIRKRRIGYLFQDYALFPHLTVVQNIAYGLPRGSDREKEVDFWIDFFRLKERAHAYPRQLSGGQQQRTALARTLASGPELLLLDEPFSALDMRTREDMQAEMLRLKQRLKLPVVLVTHDFVEARMLGDRVAVLDQGRVLEMGDKDWIFTHPKRRFTARFLGIENVLPARVGSQLPEGDYSVIVGNIPIRMPGDPRFPTGSAAHLCIHAADVRLLVDRKRRPNTLPGRVEHIQPTGGTNRVRVRLNDGERPQLWCTVDPYVLGRYSLREGSPVRLFLPTDKLFLCE